MCGIAALFLKKSSLYPRLGNLLGQMLVTMTDRGPDSAGLAIYPGKTDAERYKITVQSGRESALRGLAENLRTKISGGVEVAIKDSHAVVTIAADKTELTLTQLQQMPDVRIMSHGKNIEIYKEVGLPEHVLKRFSVTVMQGSHAVGHTRMATESVVTTMGAHPFSTGPDQFLVHNGSLSNHNHLRRQLQSEGITFETDNDSEVAAAYISRHLAKGLSLNDALQQALVELDGFYTFVVGTQSGFGVLRDPIACKPAVLAETDDYVAMGSEYRALADLPDINTAKIWEPEPATVYFWEH